MDEDRTQRSADKNSKNEKGQEKRKKQPSGKAWVWKVSLLTFVISIVLGILSSDIDSLDIVAAFVVLFLFIAVGVIFDFIGLAVATADEKSFHSMSARRIPAGRKAVMLIKNAEKVSSFCNDVIGDICGVVSGATGAAIALRLFMSFGASWHFFGSLIITALISTLMIGSKAALKGVGIRYSNEVVRVVAQFLCFFDIFGKNNKKKTRE